MKAVKSTSHGSERLLRSAVLLLSLCCWTACSDEPTQENAPEATVTSAGAPLIKHTPKPVESIVVDGVTYDLEGANRALLEALSSNDDKRKTEFLAKAKSFRKKLRESDLIPRLKNEFPKQSDPEVRGGILELVMFSNDPRMKELCDLAKKDPDAKIRAFAGA